MSANNNEVYFNVVLVEPEIPNNTGNIGRTCVGLNAKLHLVGKLGFEISDKQLKRSGLDYWPHLNWQQYESFEEWEQSVPDSSRVFYFTTKAQKSFYDTELRKGDYLVFGKETKGLDNSLIQSRIDQCVKLPMIGPIRSQNLSNTVAVALYEGIRQLGIK